MKILHVVPSLSPLLGGPTNVALQLNKSLLDLGVDTQILTTDDNRGSHLEVPINEKVLYKGVPTTFLPCTWQAKEFIYSSELSKWRHRLSSFDLIHTHYLFSYLPGWCAWAARRQNVPYIMRPLGQLTPWALTQSSTKKKLYSSLIERRNLQQAAAIHCTSKEETKNVKDFGIRAPSISLPLGVVAPERIHNAKQILHHIYQIPIETPVVLFLSRIHPKKQPEVLVKALKELVNDGCYHVIFAGTGDPSYVVALRSLVKQLGLEKNVTFTGFVSGYDKNLLLQGSDVFALPSHSENFGIAVAEALISKLPVVITPGIQISTEIQAAAAGIIVEARASEFAYSIQQIIEQPDLSRQLSENGFRLANTRYSWRAIAKDLCAVYEDIHLNRNRYSGVNNKRDRVLLADTP